MYTHSLPCRNTPTAWDRAVSGDPYKVYFV